MLESVPADILTRVLGQYLQGIDRQSVHSGAWSRLIEFRNAALPVTVESGFIGLLRLVVP